MSLDINECGSNPCQNGGSCTDKLNGYSCTCVTGYIGSHCAQGKKIGLQAVASIPVKFKT